MFMKSYVAAVLLAASLLGGCRDAGMSDAPLTEETQAASVAPSAPGDATTGNAQLAALVVDESKIVPISSDDLAAAEWTRKDCTLDSVDGITTDISVVKLAPHVFSGFLIDESGVPAGTFSAVLKGMESYEIPVTTGASRPDVVEHFKNEALAQAGYVFSSTLAAIPAGKYEVLMLVRRGKNSYFCESGKSIVVK